MNADMGIVIPAWALSDHAKLLDAAVGEGGLERVVVPAVSGAVQVLRLSGGDPAPFASEAGWHYPTEAARYANTRLKPRVARWFGGRHPLERAVQRAAQLGIRLTLRVELLSCAAAQDWPSARQKTAWGHEQPDRAACPGNPDLRQLLEDTLGELAVLDPAGFEIDDWLGEFEGDAPPLTPLPLCNALLGVCFCESCRQTALAGGVDPELAARSVRVRFARALDDPTALSSQVDADPVLNAYRAVRHAQRRAWLERLATMHDSRSRHVRTALRPAATRSTAAVGPASGWTPLVEVGQGSSAGLPAEAVATAVSVAIWRPSFHDASALVRYVRALVDARVPYVDFDGADEAPPEALDWLRQALRFARRG